MSLRTELGQEGMQSRTGVNGDPSVMVVLEDSAVDFTEQGRLTSRLFFSC